MKYTKAKEEKAKREEEAAEKRKEVIFLLLRNSFYKPRRYSIIFSNIFVISF